jgi:hypothetical protein
MLGSVDSQPSRPQDRGREIETRLGAVRLRLQELRDRGRSWDAINSATITPGERVAAAQRHAAEAHAAAVVVLVSSADAFRHAAEAHERAASMHERAAAKGIGDVAGHERQAILHRGAAAADWERAERVQLLLSGNEGAPRPGG